VRTDVITKPYLVTSCHLTHMQIDDFEVQLSEKKALKEQRDPYRVLSMGGVDFYLTDELAEKIINSMEQSLYDESSWRSTMDQNLVSVEVKIEVLRDRVRELEEQVEVLKYRNGRAI